MRFRDLPAAARAYIIYHSLVSPALITWYALPFYLLSIGYGVLEVGFLFTVVNVLCIPVTLLLGRVFTRVDIRHGLATIDAMESVSKLVYYFAYGPLTPLMVVLGGLVEKASDTLYFLYSAYEKVIYPRDRLKDSLSWHLRLPELAIVVSYPVIGYFLGYVCSCPECFRLLFLFFAVYQAAMIPYIYMFFRPVVLEAEREERVTLRGWRRYCLYVLSDVLFTLGWSFAPSLALVYLVVEWVDGNMFHVALIEAAISTATLTGTVVVDRISERRAFLALQLGTLVTLAGLSVVVLTNEFVIVLFAFYVIRLGDTLVFVFRRAWLYSIMGVKEASTVSAALSSVRRAISVVSPLLAGALASIDPRAPYIACLVTLALTIPVYTIASVTSQRR